MSNHHLIAIIVVYFLLLLALAWVTGRHANNEAFFIGNRKSNWALVAFGMVGTSLSGVTFISVPGTVASSGWSYLQVVVGNWIGFTIVALVLLPLYYRLQLTSIYDYLDRRFGVAAHKTGASFFILSRTLGATARLYLVVSVLHALVGEPAGIPFVATTLVILLMIWLYTFQGGVKTIVFTDTLQTACMLGGLLICVNFLVDALGGGWQPVWQKLDATPLTNVWNNDLNAGSYWLKQVLGGAFIAIAMTGLDQEMMQKNISVPNLRDSQKNMFVFSIVLVFVNLLFLLLGALLTMYAQARGISIAGDQLFPTIVMQHFPAWIQIIFFVALISALFPSADGAMTALTSSFCIDILGIRHRAGLTDANARRIRQITHVGFAGLFFLLVMVFRWLNDQSIIGTILLVAGYTYGPLLGLFCFGLFSQRRLSRGATILAAALSAPLISFLLQKFLATRPGGYQIGIELLMLNGALTYLFLWMASSPAMDANPDRLGAKEVLR